MSVCSEVVYLFPRTSRSILLVWKVCAWCIAAFSTASAARLVCRSRCVLSVSAVTLVAASCASASKRALSVSIYWRSCSSSWKVSSTVALTAAATVSFRVSKNASFLSLTAPGCRLGSSRWRLSGGKLED